MIVDSSPGIGSRTSAYLYGGRGFGHKSFGATGRIGGNTGCGAALGNAGTHCKHWLVTGE